MKICLHIGAGKCASSSIQTHFTFHHTIQYNSKQESNIEGSLQNNLKQTHFAYGVLDEAGHIYTGSQLQLHAMRSIVNFSDSFPLEVEELSASFIENFDNALKMYSQKVHTLLLSHEVWRKKSHIFQKLNSVLSQYDVETIFIIRPIVEWYNSAWWQWGNWETSIDCIDTWIKNTSLSWKEDFFSFKALPFVKKSHLLTLQPNLIEQIYTILNLPLTSLKSNKQFLEKTNESSSAELLMFLSSHKYLRPQNNPNIEFALNRNLQKRSPALWVLSSDNIKYLLKKYKDSSLELAQHIENEDILQNPLWWERSAYADKLSRFSRDIKLSKQSMEDMLIEAYHVIHKLDSIKKKQEVENFLLLQKIEELKMSLRKR